MKEEIWKIIEDFSDYMVSNMGEVKRIKSGLILKPGRNKDGYLRVDLYKNKKPEHKYIHHLVCGTFNNYKLKDDECVHHINENKDNNNIDNLKKMSKFDHNSLHHKGSNHPMFGKKHSEETIKLMKEKTKKGENHPLSILTEKAVIKIWKFLNEGILSQRKIAKLFGVCHQQISNIKLGKTWKHIKIE